MFVWLVSPDSSVDPALDCGYRSIVFMQIWAPLRWRDIRFTGEVLPKFR